MTIGFEAIASYMPDKKRYAKEYAYMEHLVGVNGMAPPAEKRILEDKNAAELLAVGTARKLLDRAGLGPDDIDFLIADHIGGNLIIPGLAGHIYKELGLREEVPAWNLQNCCAGFLDGCRLAESLLKADEEYNRILVVVSSAFHTGEWGNDFSDPFCMIAADGAAGAIISRQNLKCEFLAYANQTYAKLYDSIWIRMEPPTDPELLKRLDKSMVNVMYKAGSHTPETGFQEFVEETGRYVASKGVTAVLKKAGLNIDDLDIVIPHQPLRAFIDVQSEELEKIGVPREKIKETFDTYGMVAAADHATNLEKLMEKGELRPGSVIAMTTVAGGGHCPTLLIRWL